MKESNVNRSVEPRWIAWVSVFMLVMSAVAGWAQQQSAAITGTISDPSGAAVTAAIVKMTNLETGSTRVVSTDTAGYYRALALPVGHYEVRAEKTGFKAMVRTGIELVVGQHAIVDMQIRLGTVQETVTISGEPPLVNTSSASTSGVVEERQVEELPLNGRSFDQLIYLQPGVNVATAAGSSPNQGRGTKFSVAGARLTSNVFMLDGTDINDSQNFTPGGAGGQLPGVESIREFQVITHNASAEFGRSMGGIINAVSKSGTNSLHGDVYEFLRNSALDAKNFFDDPNQPIPLFIRNQFGASAGGPIKRDRLFFFGNYEGLRERLGVSKFASVPDQDARNGVINGKQVTVNPAVIPYLELYPMPNGPNVGAGVATLQFSQTQPASINYVTGKIDWNASSRDSVFGRYTIDSSSKLRQDAPDHVLGLFAEDETHKNQYVTLQHTHVFSGSTLNTARFGFNRSVALVNLFNQAGVPASLSFIPGQPFGRINVGGLSTMGATINDPRLFRMNSLQPSDDLSITRGKHTFKTGFVIERFQWNTANFNRIGGDYSFDNLTNFLLGAPKSVTVPFPGSDPSRGIRSILFGTYFQDDFRAASRLTLNLGLRYELTTVPTEVNGKLWFLPDPSATAIQTTQPFAGNHKNFAPRFGFAWDLLGNGKTSVRGGFGVYYDQILLNQFLNLFDRNPAPDLKHGWLTVTLQCPKPPCAQSVVPFPNPLSVAQSTNPGFSLQNALFSQFYTPYSHQYSLTVERQLGNNLVASVGYVGSRGKHIVERYDGNTPIPITLPGGVPCNPGPVSATNPILPAGTLCTPSGAKRRNPLWSDLQTRSMTGVSYYDSLQISVTRPLGKALKMSAVYTWAKSIDTSGGLFSEEADNSATGLQIPDNVFADKGLSNFDIRHNVVFNILYQVPFGRSLTGVAGQLLNGWQIGTITTIASGVPFTVENSANRSQNLATGANFSDRPNLVSGFSNNPTRGISAGCTIGKLVVPAGTHIGNALHWFDPCDFRPQPLGTFGNVGRNTLIGPGLIDWDFSLGKNFALTESKQLEFRTEAFYLLKHSNFEAPNANFRRIFDAAGNLVSNTFGQLSRTTTTSRQIQFGLKFIF